VGASVDSLAYATHIQQASTPNQSRVLATQKTGGGYKWRTDLNPLIQTYKEKGVTVRTDWEDVKDQVMKEVLLCKYARDEHCRQVLIGTGDRPLVEHTSRDSYWADGGDGEGQNKLGLLLMEVRHSLQAETPSSPTLMDWFPKVKKL
jgi:ribA/ribD-fused uncharacterized protein